METLVATALPVAKVTVLTLAVVGAPAALVPRTSVTFVAVVTRATGVVLAREQEETGGWHGNQTGPLIIHR